MRYFDRLTALERRAERLPPAPEMLPPEERRARLAELLTARFRRNPDPLAALATARTGQGGPGRIDELAAKFVADLTPEAYEELQRKVTL